MWLADGRWQLPGCKDIMITTIVKEDSVRDVDDVDLAIRKKQ
jgi:hypothetical protein